MNYTDKMLREGALEGKTIVVTGGGSGLGKSMTRYFLELGARVVITSRNLDKLQKAKDELESQTGGTVLPVSCDVRDYQQVQAVVEQSVAEFGKVDVLLNNAAGNFISPTERLSANAFDTIIDIVLKGTKNCTLAFGKHWIDKGETNKVVLNIVTTYAWTGSAYVVPSATAKAGVLAMTRSLAVEWAASRRSQREVRPGQESTVKTCGRSPGTGQPGGLYGIRLFSLSQWRSDHPGRRGMVKRRRAVQPAGGGTRPNVGYARTDDPGKKIEVAR